MNKSNLSKSIGKYGPLLVYVFFALYNLLTAQKNINKDQKNKNEKTMAVTTLVLGALCHFGHTKIAWGILAAAFVLALFLLYEAGQFLKNLNKNKNIGGCAGTLAGCCADGTTQAKSPIDPCKN
jgi:hypothetical protein